MKLIGSLALTCALLPSPARAQCASFTHPFEHLPGIDGTYVSVTALAGFDDGFGPTVFAAGVFGAGVFGGPTERQLVKFDGARWVSPFTPPSLGFEGNASGGPRIYALGVWDDGTGDALYTGGTFTKVDGVSASAIAKWNGTTWSPLGSGLAMVPTALQPVVNAMLPWNDGTGDALYVGGQFNQAGSVGAHRIAKWNGSAWSALGAGIDNGYVNALAEFDDGSGPALYIGGSFSHANGIGYRNIVRWNGSTYSGLGAGLDSYVSGLTVFDDGSGPALYAHGSFQSSGVILLRNVARWKNGQWSPVDNNSALNIYSMAVFDDGSGDGLYALAVRPLHPYWRTVLKLAGTSWVEVATMNDYPLVAKSIDLGAGQALYVGGSYDRIGDALTSGLARWDGSNWSSLGQGGGRPGLVETLAAHAIAGTTALYADSGTVHTGSTDESVVRWDGANWNPVGELSNGNIHALASHDDGSGAKLYAGGDFDFFGTTGASGVASFDGVAWQPVGAPGPAWTDIVWALQPWASPAGARLVVGGEFVNLGAASLWYIGAWNGTGWSALGGGMNERVYSLGVFGPDLYAGGWFTQAGGVPANYIARWNGTQWSALGLGLDATPWAMASFDDGSGPALYVGGEFTHAGGASAKHIARWNGTQWSAVGAGLNGSVDKLIAFDDGSGLALFAGGTFTASGGVPTRCVARWNGATWNEIDPTLNDEVFAMAVVDHANGESSLFLGGNFTQAGGASSLRVAEYRRSFPCAPVVYCTAQTNSLGCVPSIYATGDPSLTTSTFRVRATNIVNNKNGVLFWGLAPTAVPFHGGTKCIQAPTVRTPFQDSGGNAPPDDCSGNFAYLFGASYMASSGLEAGERIYCQYWSRDPASASTTNLTDALSFLVAP